jgi:hypothetical protein
MKTTPFESVDQIRSPTTYAIVETPCVHGFSPDELPFIVNEDGALVRSRRAQDESRLKLSCVVAEFNGRGVGPESPEEFLMEFKSLLFRILTLLFEFVLERVFGDSPKPAAAAA